MSKSAKINRITSCQDEGVGMRTLLLNQSNLCRTGGGSGIRTHDTVSRIHAFQASAFSHSAIPPRVAAGNIVEVGGLTTHKHSTDKDLGPGLISARPAVHDPGVMPFCRRALLAAVL